MDDAFSSFSNKAPAFPRLVEDYNKLPDEVNKLGQELTAQKEALAGLTAEEREIASGDITNYENKFNEAVQKRADTEKTIKEQLGVISARHNELKGEKQILERGVKDYGHLSDKLSNTQADELYHHQDR